MIDSMDSSEAQAMAGNGRPVEASVRLAGAAMTQWLMRLLVGLACLNGLTGAAARGSELHVSLTGHDGAPGTQQAPFASLERAQAEVRKQVAAGLQAPVTVFLHAGVYELTTPLTFGPADAGTVAFAVTYKAVPGAVVVLSGGRRIANWRKDGRGWWTADLPDMRTGTWFFRQLVVNDRRAVRARWPDEDGVLRLAGVGEGVRRFAFNLPLLAESFAGQDTELVVFENWAISRGLVTASDGTNLTTATPMGWIGHGALTASPGKPAFLEHARAFLDKPGEWFLDRAEGVLHYVPVDGEESTAPLAVAPVLTRLIAITGTKDAPVRNLHFEGLRFEHADFPLPDIGYNEIQAAHHGTTRQGPTFAQPVAVAYVYAEGCGFDRCRFAHLNSSGIGFGPGCRMNTVVGCAIEDIGGNGVMVGWRGVGDLETGAARTLDADWADPADAPVSNTVANCHLQRCGADGRGGVGIFAAFSADTRIVHNVIHDMPYSGISIGFRWNTTPTTQARCLVEANHIFDVMQQLADGGGIYTLGYQPGTVFRGNHIHDVKRSAYAHGRAPNNGFFIDEGSKGFVFESNVVHNTSGGPVRFNQSARDWHTWQTNFLGDAEVQEQDAAPIIDHAGLERHFRVSGGIFR